MLFPLFYTPTPTPPSAFPIKQKRPFICQNAPRPSSPPTTRFAANRDPVNRRRPLAEPTRKHRPTSSPSTRWNVVSPPARSPSRTHAVPTPAPFTASTLLQEFPDQNHLSPRFSQNPTSADCQPATLQSRRNSLFRNDRRSPFLKDFPPSLHCFFDRSAITR